MKRLLPITVCVMLSALLSGCFIQSFQPFYTDNLVVGLPTIKGKWLLVKRGDENVAEKYPQPWVFTEDEIATFEDNVCSVLDVKYFMVENVTFVDLTPSRPDKDTGPNEWWTIHTIPVHSVCKVDLLGESLSLTPLAGDWVQEMLEKRQLSLARFAVDDKGDQIVLTSSSAELVLFLKQYGGDTNAFPIKASHRFQRELAKGKK